MAAFDHIAVFQGDWRARLNPHVVNKRAIQTAQIIDQPAVAVPNEPGMMARHTGPGRAIRPQVNISNFVAVGAANNYRIFVGDIQRYVAVREQNSGRRGA